MEGPPKYNLDSFPPLEKTLRFISWL